MTSRWTPGAILIAVLAAFFVAGCGSGVPLVGNDDAGVVISFDKPVSDIVEPGDINYDGINDFVPGELPDTQLVDDMPPGCEDNDRDGYGRGLTCRGPDCDDHNPTITDQCYQCAYPDVREGCSCEPGSQPLPCDVITGRSSGLDSTCVLGQRTCSPNRNGGGWSWGVCERWRPNFQYIGPVSACPGSCLPTCRHQVICPESGDAFPAGSTGLRTGTSVPAVFCPSGTTSGGVTSTCMAVSGEPWRSWRMHQACIFSGTWPSGGISPTA